MKILRRSEMWLRRLGQRRVVFAAAAVVGFFLVVSVALKVLEAAGLVDSNRLDDAVTHVRPKLLKEINTSKGVFYTVDDCCMLLSVMPQQKPPGVFRIFFMGSSFALGTPYAGQENWGRKYGDIASWLHAMLVLRYPAGKFEVINAGIGGANSSRIRSVLTMMAKAEPDLVILATGNNEAHIPNYVVKTLHEWIVYRILKKLLLRRRPREERPAYYAPTASLAEINRLFQDNIRAMAEIAHRRGFGLMLSKMPINLTYDYRFTKNIFNIHKSYLFLDEPIIRGVALQDQGHCDEAIAELERSANRGMASKLIGDCLVTMGRYDEAKTAYLDYAARLPFGRTSPLNNAFLAKFARERGLPLADLERALDDVSPHGIPTQEYFHDSCHMTWSGYFLMAEEIMNTIIASKVLPASFGEPGPPPSKEEIIERFHWDNLDALQRKYVQMYTGMGIANP